MKWIALFLFLLSYTLPNAQEITKLYDYNWKEVTNPNAVAFVSTIIKKDSFYERLDYDYHRKCLYMKGHYKDSFFKTPVDTFYYFYPNGNLLKTGPYTQGKKNGTWLYFYDNQMMSDSLNFKNDIITGTSLRWYSDGSIKDSIYNFDDSITVLISWFDNGIPSAGGRFLNGKMYGPWAFYDEKDSLINKTYYSETGEIIDTLNRKDRRAEFPDGDEAWSRYLYRNLDEIYKESRTSDVFVDADFDIDEEGKLINITFSTPKNDFYDKIVYKAINSSPKWKPMFINNRALKCHRLQSFTFKFDMQ